jgi:predicted regulator of Ras-like GTPase activity (Roadblock/LC7/MglB family)
MVRRSLITAFAAIALSAVLWGCSGAATPQPAASSPTSAASAAAPSVAASEAAPSSAAASDAAVASSGALPSLVLPSEVKELEALLPSKMCGQAAQKLSLSGDTFSKTADQSFVDALKALGKQVSDVSMAVAFSPGSCGAGIFRIAGTDASLFKAAMLSSMQESGSTATEGNVGGKNVTVVKGENGNTYIYFSGDAAIFAEAKNDTDAAGILKDLP